MEKIEHVYLGRGVSVPMFESIQRDDTVTFTQYVNNRIDFEVIPYGSLYYKVAYEKTAELWSNYFGSLTRKVSKNDYYCFGGKLARDGIGKILRFTNLTDYEKGNLNAIIENETLQVYENSEITIRIPVSAAGARILGLNTALCITDKDKTLFRKTVCSDLMVYVIKKTGQRIKSGINTVVLFKNIIQPDKTSYVNSHGTTLSDRYVNICGAKLDNADITFSAVRFLTEDGVLGASIEDAYNIHKLTWRERFQT